MKIKKAAVKTGQAIVGGVRWTAGSGLQIVGAATAGVGAIGAIVSGGLVISGTVLTAAGYLVKHPEAGDIINALGKTGGQDIIDVEIVEED